MCEFSKNSSVARRFDNAFSTAGFTSYAAASLSFVLTLPDL